MKKIKKCFPLVLFLISIVLSFTSCTNDTRTFYERRAQLDKKFLEEGIELYKEVAGYAVKDNEANHYVKKWLSPIRFRYEGAVSEKNKAAMEELVTYLNTVPGMPKITITNELGAAANCKIMFNDLSILQEQLFDEKYNKATGFYMWWKGEPGYEIYWSHLGFAVDLMKDKKNQEASVKQNLIGILGFLAHSNNHRNSIFQDDLSKVKKLSKLDKLVLEMHYRPEIKPGMDIDRAVEILEYLYLDKGTYNPDDDIKVAADSWTDKDKEQEAKEVKNCQNRWTSYGVKLNTEGPRKTFYEQRKQIDKEFFERGLKYYEQVAGYGEFDSTYDGIIKKWGNNPVHIYVDESGFADVDPKMKAYLYKTLDRVLMQLNSLGSLPKITYSNDKAQAYQIKLVFDTLADIQKKVENARWSEWGIFSYFWDPSFQINRAEIGISTDVTTPITAAHLLQEELIQSFGLVNDSYDYADSVFQQKWGYIQYPGELDWLLIEFHYRPEIKAGMQMTEALKILRKLYIEN